MLITKTEKNICVTSFMDDPIVAFISQLNDKTSELSKHDDVD